jgi:predicted lipoprotein with Yx(FWY)xxD motif
MSGRALLRYSALAGLTIAMGVVSASANAASPAEAPYSTPEGIMVVTVTKSMDDAIPQYMWRRLGDSNGNPLYTYDADKPGRSSCNAECAVGFPPLLADAKAQAYGDFSIIVRSDKSRQWAYQGKALHRYSGKDPNGEPVGARISVQEDPAWSDPASEIYSPARGWRRAAFAPEKTVTMPGVVELTAIGIANGFGFVDTLTRHTVYAAPVSHKLSVDWRPLRAGALEMPAGDFTIVTRSDDGTLQWAYRGEVLYTYAGDSAPGEVHGIEVGDSAVRPALAYRNFLPQGVGIQHVLGRQPVLTDDKGHTLYMISRYQIQYGGRLTREGFMVSYNDVKDQGTVACEGECTETWKPLLAPANARGQGFWEVIKRPEGTNQWVYKGSPLYTFTGDQQPGDLEGDNRYVVMFGGPKGEVDFSNTAGDPRPNAPQPKLGTVTIAKAAENLRGFSAGVNAGAGFYWRAAGLFY